MNRVMKFYYTYIVLCADNSYYIGITNNLEKRIEQHNEGINRRCYTFKRRPVTLKWNIQCTNPEEAIKIEKQLKGWSRKKKEALIKENWRDLVRFSKNHTQFGKPE